MHTLYTVKFTAYNVCSGNTNYVYPAYSVPCYSVHYLYMYHISILIPCQVVLSVCTVSVIEAHRQEQYCYSRQGFPMYNGCNGGTLTVYSARNSGYPGTPCSVYIVVAQTRTTFPTPYRRLRPPFPLKKIKNRIYPSYRWSDKHS